jgi:hypothetical protein
MNYQTISHWRSILAGSLALLPFSAQSELVGYYKLDGNFDDSSGNGNTGEFFGGASYAPESPAVLGGGQSVLFDHGSTFPQRLNVGESRWASKPRQKNFLGGAIDQQQSAL